LRSRKPKWRRVWKSAIDRVIAEGKVRIYDMGGKDSTLDVAKAIADYAT